MYKSFAPLFCWVHHYLANLIRRFSCGFVTIVFRLGLSALCNLQPGRPVDIVCSVFRCERLTFIIHRQQFFEELPNDHHVKSLIEDVVSHAFALTFMLPFDCPRPFYTPLNTSERGVITLLENYFTVLSSF